METMTKLQRFQMIIKIYTRITLVMLVFAMVIFVIGYGYLGTVTAAPDSMIALVEFFFYYHIAHFLGAFVLIGYYLFRIKKRFGKTKISGVVASIFLSPVSIIITYFGLLMMAISSCSA